MQPMKHKNDNTMTYSRMSCYQACNMRHYYRYECGVMPIQINDSLVFGTAWHTALETDDIELAVKGLAGLDEYAQEALRAMYSAYTERYQPLDCLSKEEIYSTKVTTERGYEWTIAGKIDKIVKAKTCAIAFDHKTTTMNIDPGSPYWTKMKINMQFGVYDVLLRYYGWDIHQFCYDVAKVPSLSPQWLTQAETKVFLDTDMYYGRQVNPTALEWKKGKSGNVAVKESKDMYGARVLAEMREEPDKYFQRMVMVKSDIDFIEAKDQIAEVISQITDIRDEGRCPKNDEACFSQYGLCPYIDLCHAHWQPEDGIEQFNGRFYITDNVHPELQETK